MTMMEDKVLMNIRKIKALVILDSTKTNKIMSKGLIKRKKK